MGYGVLHNYTPHIPYSLLRSQQDFPGLRTKKKKKKVTAPVPYHYR
jgi:hypothetical protein